MRPTSLLRRLAAALWIALFLQFTLLGSGRQCVMHEGAATNIGAPMHGMQGMATREMSRSSVSLSRGMRSDSPAAPASCDGSRTGGGCGLPRAPGQCASMATCATTAAPSAMVVAAIGSSVAASDLPEPGRGHTGPTVSPELPPPRA